MHERIAIGQLLDEPARRELQVDHLVGRLVESEAEQQREVVASSPLTSPSRDRGRHRAASLLRASAATGSFSKMPAARADDLGDAAVRRLLLVRQAATPQHPRRRWPSTSAVASAPAATCRCRRGPSTVIRCGSFPRSRRGPRQSRTTAAPGRDRRAASARSVGWPAPHGSPTSQAAHGLALALRSIGSSSSNANACRAADRSPRRRRAAGGRGRLQPGGGVHDVAGRERLPGRRVERDHGLAAADGGADLEVELRVAFVQLARSPRARRARPARRARRRRSRARGAPNTAITASPMYFSTTPPYRSIRSRSSW